MASHNYTTAMNMGPRQDPLVTNSSPPKLSENQNGLAYTTAMNMAPRQDPLVTNSFLPSHFIRHHENFSFRMPQEATSSHALRNPVVNCTPLEFATFPFVLLTCILLFCSSNRNLIMHPPKQISVDTTECPWDIGSV